ncbi:N-acetylmuramoyl-L-alanine amidase [Pantoea stewartii]|uniref:N-acetylmuramoyl-L-alanine amidase n=1 Tax=Pantoea stewartii TaxID=66269 RepID=A0AB34VHV7_9GAMM|nr:N-acetylmuramoyl-L-alanine amidase [Pantoea stewartii]KTS72219.1 N-acetylmuramoyl-L-alanine amidase [Pantoea stewartii]KTS97647.1 N-acetylmuramoyl-L-alanine amidase [Pantoea stewartii]KTT04915.1 N-acetylmuramoyl-L-alanine amidase [Pantoea stewartii]
MSTKLSAKIFIINFICLIIITGCSNKNSDYRKRQSYAIDKSHVSLAQNQRIRFLIFHYTAVDNATSLKLLTGENVSAHYLISDHVDTSTKKTIVYKLVSEDKRAWHAGTSNWNGRTNLNDSSVGIEIVNLGFKKNFFGKKIWYPYSQHQIKTIAALANDIILHYGITPDNVLGHSDIAPLRKEDPGILFPWKKLAALGVGAWPDPEKVKYYLHGREKNQSVDVSKMQKLLSQYGYDRIPQSGELDEATQKTISAFQMHFRPSKFDGKPDAETEAIAMTLIHQYRDPSN